MMTEHEAWTPEQIEYLRQNWETLSDHQLAEVLNRSWHSVRHKRCDLNMIRYSNKKKLVPVETFSSAIPAEEYYDNWAARVECQVKQLLLKNGTYKEKPICAVCNRRPCVCQNAKLPSITWVY